MFDESKLGHGALQDRQEQSVREYDHLVLGAAPFDWVAGYDVEDELGIKLPTKDQKQVPSCVGEAAATLAYVINAFELLRVYGHGSVLKDHLQELSSKSVYSQIALGFDQGAYISDGAELLVDYGINTEKEVPSKPKTNEHMFEVMWRNPALYDNAKNYQGREARMIRAKHDISLMAQAIRDNGGVLIGVNGQNNGTWSSLFPQPPKFRQWGHCMYAGKAKLINNSPFIGVKQSWGDNVGDKGWQWLGEDWFTSENIFNPWVLVDKDNIERVKLFDRNGRPRWLPTYMFKAIRYLVNDRGYKFN